MRWIIRSDNWFKWRWRLQHRLKRGVFFLWTGRKPSFLVRHRVGTGGFRRAPARWLVGGAAIGVSGAIGALSIGVLPPQDDALRPPGERGPATTTMAKSLDCLAHNLYHEARGEPLLGQIAVAKVVMNRITDRHFPSSVCAVVTQRGALPHHGCQFSWWCDGKSDRIADRDAMLRIRKIADQVLHGEHDDPTEGALWYHATSVRPNWATDFAKGPTIGKHVFYKPRPR